MAKRAAAHQLTQDTCEEEDEIVDRGVFQKATSSALKERVMKKAKRQINAGDNPSPFSAFVGLSSNKKSPFVFQSNGKDQKNSPNTTSALFGSSNLIKPNLFSTSTAPATKTFSPTRTLSSSTLNLPSSTASASLTMIKTPELVNKTSNNNKNAGKAQNQRDPAYFQQMKVLNESFLNWVKDHMIKNSYADFTPVCKDYEKHAHMVGDKFKPESASSTDVVVIEPSKDVMTAVATPAAIKTTPGMFSFGTKSTVSSDIKFNANQNSPPSIMTASKTASAKDLFSFGTKSVSFNSTNNAFSMTPKFPTSIATSNMPKFSFGTQVASAMATKTAATADEQFKTNDPEDDNYVPPKNEFKLVEETDSVYSQRCKLFFKKNEEYTEKGVGHLHLKPLNGKTQLIIRANTSLGRIILNTMLSESIPTQRVGKNNVLIVCPTPQEKSGTAEGVPGSFLIRVKTSEEADALFTKIEELKC